MINIGKVNYLIVDRSTSSGYYLRDKDQENEVFMPPSLGPLKVTIGEELKVFIYLDTTGSPIATDQIPFAQVGEYALLRAIDVQDFGAFFDWGISKDLLVPGNEQKFKVRQHEDHLIRVCLEEETGRVFGTTKLGKYIESSKFNFAVGDKVKITPVKKTDLGHRVIVNKEFIGMIYANETFCEIIINQEYDAVVKKLRPDGLVDTSLQVQGFDNVLNSKDVVLKAIMDAGGKLNLHDKSSPQKIRDILGMSKKTFKSAIGILYKERKIIIEEDEIRLTES